MVARRAPRPPIEATASPTDRCVASVRRTARTALFRLALAVVSSTDAFAGRPLDTDDAAIIPRGTCQLESFVRRVDADERAGPRRDVGSAPSCNPFGWGEWLVGFERDGVGQPSSGIAPILQIKAVPRQVARTAPGWGFSGTLDEVFVRGRQSPAGRVGAVNGIFSAPVATTGQIDANGGWLHEWAPAGNGRRDHATWGLAYEWAATRAWTLVGERTGASRQGYRSQIGVSWAVSPRVTLDAAFGRRHQPDDTSRFVTVGVTIVSSAVGTGVGTPPGTALPAVPGANTR